MDFPHVGIGVIIVRDGKILLGKRKNAHGEGTHQFPGGHLEFGESWEDCARREVMEETGLHVKKVRFATATNDVFSKENKHYITIFMLAEPEDGEPKVMEPEKCEEWKWVSWNYMPRPLFLPIE
ncbi:MAG: NUDIX domain-containing protein, partial [Candidatus Aenigmarchaeota archaeon]|nr:NUDIX domain-containing protein [Candidatus Aenigmarchaeota archaeon]